MLTIIMASTIVNAANAIDDCKADYPQCLQDWKNDRLRFLNSEDGYLNLAGLYWLKSGSQTLGGGEFADLRIPGLRDIEIGRFVLENNVVHFVASSGVDVRINDELIENAVLKDDMSGTPDHVVYENYSWTIIRRVDRFAVRLRDMHHPALTDFAPIDYFPIDNGLRVTAELQRYEQPRTIRVDTVIEGLEYNPISPGIVTFALGNENFELEAYAAGDELFLVFGDGTNRDQTYPAGRFLYTKAPLKNEAFVLDFNTAHSPPCAYNDFATCPVASPRNRLPIAIKAGELYDRSRH